MDNQIIPADKSLRKKVLLIVLLCIPIGFFLIQSVTDYIEVCKSLADTDIDLAIRKMKELIALIMVINALVSSAIGLYLIFLAVKILKSNSYPPPGMKVIQDTRIRTGKKAKIAGAAFIFMAMLILSTNLIIWYLHVIVENHEIHEIHEIQP
jgi:hypothetical protein